VPLTESGAAYELATAIKAVPQSYRSVGRWITFRTTSGEWETMQFNGSSTDMWGRCNLRGTQSAAKAQ